ncbi:inositol monophosphatase family protein [Fimbriimonas ginsengisoli]|uniref:Histidinol-phosphate phosphatase n=1 Tax=Fimbriimonas ginsengisoli Gsoil 348 TaxID=661478 RepID=A0A068NS31_FIMGI|nr:inositol monophosphatase family protein [Fimbriimonas ginsengisoli]AIE84424.1 histidinol-phosphate phosphatase [Fimbriimonas ginsengisoli Gsoil 348]
MSPRLAFAVEAAYRAGRSTLAHFQAGVGVDLKADLSPVTVADRNAERMIRQAIAAVYPHDAILGEEEGGASDALDRWVIDPIDGTKSFVSGVPLYATLLSYEQDGQPILGVCYFPALGEMLYAERGQGCTLNGRPCRVSAKSDLPESVLACGGPKSMIKYGRWDGFATLSGQTLATRTWSDAYGHALVASGRIEAMVDPIVTRWDLSAIKILIEEAGGKFTDFRGGDPFTSAAANDLEAVSSNGVLHEEILRAFA